MKMDWTFPYSSRRVPVIAQNVVSTSQPLASQAGIRMLQEGGNAVDAALAAAITLTVVEPTGNGLGSDAFALIWDGKKLHGINGSGPCPAAWSPEKFHHLGQMPVTGWDSVTVPGAVSVWAELSEKLGRLPFSRLFETAIGYAREGYGVTPLIAARWKSAAVGFEGNEDFARLFLPGGRPPVPGERFFMKDAAATLEEIAETAGESFYRGKLAERIAA